MKSNDKKLSPLGKSLQAAFGFIGMLVILVKCGYDVTGPHTCEEARSEERSAKESLDSYSWPSKSDFEASAASGAFYKHLDAQDSVRRFCR